MFSVALSATFNEEVPFRCSLNTLSKNILLISKTMSATMTANPNATQNIIIRAIEKEITPALHALFEKFPPSMA